MGTTIANSVNHSITGFVPSTFGLFHDEAANFTPHGPVEYR
jgi:hypothetical protein